MILVMPFGSTGSFTDKEWANGIGRDNGWETFVARDLVDAVDHRYRTVPRGSARILAGLSEGGYGAVNIGIHHPGEFATIESWSGYMVADNLGAIFGHRPRLLTRNTPLDTLPAAASALRRAPRLRLVLHRKRRPDAQAERRVRPRARRATGSRTDSSSCAAGTTGLSGAATRRRPISPRPGGSMVRRLALLPLVVVLSAAAAGWLYLVEPGLPGPRIGEALPLDELSRHDRRAASLVRRRLGDRSPCCSGCMHGGRPSSG